MLQSVDRHREGSPTATAEGSEFPVEAARSLAGTTVVLTGRFRIGTRDDLTGLLEYYGARVTGSVSGVADLLFVGTDPGQRKRADAAEAGVPTVPERHLYDVLALQEVDEEGLAPDHSE